MNNNLRIKATKILMNSNLTSDEIADVHEVMCMTGAIEFLRKAKAICDNTHPCADECPLNDWCHHEDDMNEADLVRKVMEYRLEERG